MGYYLRVFSKSTDHVPVPLLQAALKEENLSGTLAVEAGSETEWSELLLCDEDGEEIAGIERNPVIEDPEDMARQEVDEFIAELDDAKPARGAAWVRSYLQEVRTVYAFQILDSGGGDLYRAVMNGLRDHAGGVIQADGEGFSNEDGYHVTWDFSDHVTGPWWMAVLNDAGEWITFEMELGNPAHRAAFFSGKVPEGIAVREAP